MVAVGNEQRKTNKRKNRVRHEMIYHARSGVPSFDSRDGDVVHCGYPLLGRAKPIYRSVNSLVSIDDTRTMAQKTKVMLHRLWGNKGDTEKLRGARKENG